MDIVWKLSLEFSTILWIIDYTALHWNKRRKSSRKTIHKLQVHRIKQRSTENIGKKSNKDRSFIKSNKRQTIRIDVGLWCQTFRRFSSNHDFHEHRVFFLSPSSTLFFFIIPDWMMWPNAMMRFHWNDLIIMSKQSKNVRGTSVAKRRERFQ